MDKDQAQRLWELTDRAVSLLNAVDENNPEQAIKLVDAAVDDIIQVRGWLALAAGAEADALACAIRAPDREGDNTMTPEEIAAIQAASQVNLPALLEEVERLRAALQEIADTHVHQWDAVDPQEVWACEVCHVDSQDYATDVQEIARKALGK